MPYRGETDAGKHILYVAGVNLIDISVCCSGILTAMWSRAGEVSHMTISVLLHNM